MVLMNLYKLFIRPLLFRFYPETSHKISFRLLQLANLIPFLFYFLEKIFTFKSKRLEQVVAGIHFNNPVGLAAGFDKTGELYPLFSRLGFGFIETGTITGEEQPGNPKPRVFRFPKHKAILNRMGFNNSGAEETYRIIEKQEPVIPRGINAGKTKTVKLEDSIADYLKTFLRLAPFANYFVVNISSPNTPGLRDLQNKENFIWLLDGIQKGISHLAIPLFVKFAPDLAETDLLDLLQICLDKKVSGVILTNTTLDKSGVSAAIGMEGGLSGKPLANKSTEMIRIAYKFLQGRIPVIGAGGIDSGETALEKIKAGASLIQIYTGYIYEGPSLPLKISKHIDNYMNQNGIKQLSELVGTDR